MSIGRNIHYLQLRTVCAGLWDRSNYSLRIAKPHGVPFLEANSIIKHIPFYAFHQTIDVYAIRASLQVLKISLAFIDEKRTMQATGVIDKIVGIAGGARKIDTIVSCSQFFFDTRKKLCSDDNFIERRSRAHEERQCWLWYWTLSFIYRIAPSTLGTGEDRITDARWDSNRWDKSNI